jgi:hypothetical protein
VRVDRRNAGHLSMTARQISLHFAGVGIFFVASR